MSKPVVELRLIPAPGQKPEFVAQLEILGPPLGVNPHNKVVVLEGYTRDAWSLDSTCKWHKFQVQSVDGRNKLPGFVKYLRDRQKTAFGRFIDPKTNQSHAWVIPHKQMSSTTVTCRMAPLSSIPNCPLKPLHNHPQQPAAAAPPKEKAAPPTAAAAAPDDGKKKKKGFGLLGNLVGAQRRTNQQVKTATAKPTTSIGGGGGGESSAGTPQTGAVGQQQQLQLQQEQEESKTAGQVLADFRQEMEQQMLDFDISPEEQLKVKIDLASKLALMKNDEEKQSGRVTMEVLKYIVYEQAEEVNEEWIAHKEPSEFMDEVTIIIYKEGAAPPEVLEDINKAELPDEIRGQQKAMQEQQRKAQEQKVNKALAQQQRLALMMRNKKKTEGGDGEGEEDDDDFAVLNAKKRDRRTIEDFERAKRQRGE